MDGEEGGFYKGLDLRRLSKSIPGWTYLTETIVTSGFKLFWLVFVVGHITPIHRRIQIKHFEWLDLFYVCHFTYSYDYLSAAFVHRIYGFVHQYRHRSRWRLIKLRLWQGCCWICGCCCCILQFYKVFDELWFVNWKFLFFFFVAFVLLSGVKMHKKKSFSIVVVAMFIS